MGMALLQTGCTLMVDLAKTIIGVQPVQDRAALAVIRSAVVVVSEEQSEERILDPQTINDTTVLQVFSQQDHGLGIKCRFHDQRIPE